MDDLRFNTMALAGHERALERRRAEMAAASAEGFAPMLAAETALPTAPPSAVADIVPPPAEPPAAPPVMEAAKPETAQTAMTAEDAIKASPAAANLSADQMAVLLSSFGQASAVPAPIQALPDPKPAQAEAASGDTMSATAFFPIKRREEETAMAGAPLEARFFPVKSNASSSLYTSNGLPVPEAAEPAAPKSAAPETEPAAEAARNDTEARFYPTHPTRQNVADNARDAYLKMLDMNARTLGALHPS